MGYSHDDGYSSPYQVQPFSEFVVNATGYVSADRSTVWPVLKAMDQWSTFQDIFKVDFVDGNGVVEVGQTIRIQSDFPIPLVMPVTLEEYDEIVEEERICWTQRGFEVFGILAIYVPGSILRTARCIELFDDGLGGTMVHNWISYDGIGWPVVYGTTASIVEGMFHDFIAELAVEFV
jgi:hypothetical protein